MGFFWLCVFLTYGHSLMCLSRTFSFLFSCLFMFSFFLFFPFCRLALVCLSFSHSLHTRFVRVFSRVLVCRAFALRCFSFFLVSFALRYDFSLLWAVCIGGFGRALCAFCSWSVIMFLGCESFLHSSCAPAVFWAPTDHSSMSCSSSLLLLSNRLHRVICFPLHDCRLIFLNTISLTFRSNFRSLSLV